MEADVNPTPVEMPPLRALEEEEVRFNLAMSRPDYDSGERQKRARALFGAHGRWDQYLDEGFAFVVLVHQWAGQEQLNAARLRKTWMTALFSIEAHPLAPRLALEGLGLDLDISRSRYLDWIGQRFGPRLVAPAFYLAAHRAEGYPRVAIWEWLLQSGFMGKGLYLAALDDASSRVRQSAMQALIKLGPGVVPELAGLLQGGRSETRFCAARCLEAIGDGSALSAIVAALEAESSQKVLQALGKARDACDPATQGWQVGGAAGLPWAYAPGTRLDFNDGLSMVRAVAYGQRNAAAWIKLCNVLERLRHNSALAMAIDYLYEAGIDDWPQTTRVRPWGWEEPERLRDLAPGRRAHAWVPVDVFMGKRGEEFLNETLLTLEKTLKVRRLKHRDVGRFVQAVVAGWQWCREQGLPYELLEVRIDGGCGETAGATTTVLELFGGFGVQVLRGRSKETYKPSGLRYVAVKIPQGHRAELRHRLDSRRRLDLMPVLGL